MIPMMIADIVNLYQKKGGNIQEVQAEMMNTPIKERKKKIIIAFIISSLLWTYLWFIFF